jgi:hypothetical protein
MNPSGSHSTEADMTESKLMPDGKYYTEEELPFASLPNKRHPLGVTMSIFHSPDGRVFFRFGEETTEILKGHRVEGIIKA